MLTYYEPAAFTWNYYSWLPRGCYLERFGIPRIGVACLGDLRPRLVHRHASGAAQGKVGALPALNHKPELNAGSCIAPAILDWLRAAGPRSTINRSRAREDALRTQPGLERRCWFMPAESRAGTKSRFADVRRVVWAALLRLSHC